MKIHPISAAIFLLVQTVFAQDASTADRAIAIDTTFAHFDPNPAFLDEFKRLAPTDQPGLLVSQIQMNIPADDLENNCRKATAIRLLARSAVSNKVDILIDSLSFLDAKHRNFPTYFAFQEIGEPAVPQLMEFAITSTNYPAVEGAGGTIRAILGPQRYRELLDANKERLSDHTLQLLSTTTE